MKRILVVEDSDDVAQMFSSYLGSYGYHVDAESEPEKGIRRAEEGQYDLIIADLMMPKVTGFGVAEAVRKRDRLTPMVLITGRTDDALIRGSARKAGFTEVLFKPVDPPELLSCVRRLTDKGRRGARSGEYR